MCLRIPEHYLGFIPPVDGKKQLIRVPAEDSLLEIAEKKEIAEHQLLG